MATRTTAVELDEEMINWLEWYSDYNNIPSSEALAYVLNKGRQIVENEIPTFDLRQTEKLLIQCVMESLLILKETHLSSAEQHNDINERAKTIIRKTLGLMDPQ
jgi:hypothetical protein